LQHVLSSQWTRPLPVVATPETFARKMPVSAVARVVGGLRRAHPAGVHATALVAGLAVSRSPAVAPAFRRAERPKLHLGASQQISSFSFIQERSRSLNLLLIINSAVLTSKLPCTKYFTGRVRALSLTSPTSSWCLANSGPRLQLFSSRWPVAAVAEPAELMACSG
jgi:hypothetical protein